MNNLFPDRPLFSAFVVASFILAITPGPGVIYIVTRSAMHGRRAGFASVLGVALGTFGNSIGVSLGLALVFAISSLAFAIVKYTGAIYLIYLGVQALRANTKAPSAANETSSKRVLRDGIVVALFNPKTTLFFAAFLPQFMSHDASTAQSLALGLVFIAIAACTDSSYALAAGWIAPRLTRMNKIRNAGRYLSGGALIGLGVLAAVSNSRSAK